MTDEEINRKFDVVADHLASLTDKLDRLSDKVDRTADGVAALLAVAEIQSGEIASLGESVGRIDERQRESDERQRQADERLNALINTVERFISGGQGR